MKRMHHLQLVIFCILLIFCANVYSNSQNSSKTIHVFVALCDNKYQGIIPVRPALGNGDDPRNNLYWGALYGVKTTFKKSSDWDLLSTINKPADNILERCVFKHTKNEIYLVADAYRGREIKQATVDFLTAAAGGDAEAVSVGSDSETMSIYTGGAADMLVYIGHDGLMDFTLSRYPKKANSKIRETIILACKSRMFFTPAIRQAGAKPLLWTTGLMAPEAYTLEAALAGWAIGETDEEIRQRAAQAYHKYQNCGLKAAQNLFATGF